MIRVKSLGEDYGISSGRGSSHTVIPFYKNLSLRRGGTSKVLHSSQGSDREELDEVEGSEEKERGKRADINENCKNRK